MIGWIILAVHITWFASYPAGGHHPYHWVKALEKGTGREEAAWQEGTWPRIYADIVVQRDTLLMIGTDRTWKSVDGVHWKALPHNGKWGKRYGASYTFFKDRIWLMGGMKTWDSFANDVWTSENGLEWTLVTNSAPWSKRRGHAAVVYEDAIWVIGGAESSGRSDVLPKESLGDVWRTADGKTWERVKSGSPWQTQYSKEFFSTATSGHEFAGALWVIGGPQGNTVWQSRNGIHWKRNEEHAPWPSRHARGSAVFDHKLWVFGGEDLNDTWFSRDGKKWELLLTNAPWSPRAPGSIVAFKNRLWMYGGKTGKSDDRGDDVWYLEPGATLPRQRND